MLKSKITTRVFGTVLGASILMGTSMTLPELHKAANHLTSRASVVVAIDETADMVTTEDSVGYRWTFKGVDEWCLGDGCAMLLYDNGTPNDIRDDAIIKTDFFRIDLLVDAAFYSLTTKK